MLLSKANVQLSDTEILVNERGDKITLEIPNKVLPTKSYNVKLKVLKLTLNDNEQ